LRDGRVFEAFKAETNFVDLVPQAKQFRLTLNMGFAEISDPKGLCKDVAGLGRWGNGDVEVRLGAVMGARDEAQVCRRHRNGVWGLSSNGTENRHNVCLPPFDGNGGKAVVQLDGLGARMRTQARL
jgi:predicted transport protein